MKLIVRTMWSPDLNPPSEGRPNDLEDFKVFVQIALSEEGQKGEEVFELTVSSPSNCVVIEPPAFITHTLVLDKFSWDVIKVQIEKLLRHCSSSTNWDEAIRILSPYLHYSDG